MNEIIIHQGGTRTVIGELAHKIAYDTEMWESIKSHCLPTFFAVIEIDEGDEYHDQPKWALRANQSTIAGAHKYMACDRVLVHHS